MKTVVNLCPSIGKHKPCKLSSTLCSRTQTEPNVHRDANVKQ